MLPSLVLVALILSALLLVVGARLGAMRRRAFADTRKTSPVCPMRCRPKPPWVTREVIRLKALMTEHGHRAVADVFNRRFAETRGMTVGKTFVSNVVRKHQYQIQIVRREIKHARPRPIPLNAIWGVDLTGKADSGGSTHTMLGVVEHGARACLALQRLIDRSAAGIMLELIPLMRRFGAPRAIRSDNDAVFRSYLFRFMLILLGIKHQRTDPHCPWQNGRVERFFGTLKDKLDRWLVASGDELSVALAQFRFWYNHVRPHQHLDGRTPAEAWTGALKSRRAPQWFSAWDGLLCGDYYAPS